MTRRIENVVLVLIFLSILAAAVGLLVGLGLWLGMPGVFAAMAIIYGVPIILACTDWKAVKHGKP